MPIRSKLHAVLLAVCLALSFATVVPAASAYECEEQITKVLQERGVNQNDVKSVTVERRSGGAKSAGIYNLDAWVRLNSCSNGALIVTLTKYCMVQQSYTTGDCKVGGMSSY